MFSFHKPKIYRSIQGCCICRAKSSSSRFTDSRRYEHDFPDCFQISERRSGEICNACVLLVKRWKKLPEGSNRNWHHVVDARAGPGTKSMNKIKNKAKMEEKLLKKKHKHKHRKPKLNNKPHSSGCLSDDILDDMSDRSSQSGYSDCSDDEVSSRKSGSKRRKRSNPVHFSSFLDRTYWKRTEICCGIIYEGENGEVVVDPRLLRPCICRAKAPATPPLSRQNSSENCALDDEEEACDSGIGSQETHCDDTPPDSQVHTPCEAPTIEPSVIATCVQDRSEDEMATAQSVLELSVNMNGAPLSPALSTISDDDEVESSMVEPHSLLPMMV